MKNRPVITPMDEEEADLIESIEPLTERLPSLLTPESRAEIEAMAKATMNSERESISLDIPRTDLARLKSKALQEGIPYNVLISSLIHKYVWN